MHVCCRQPDDWILSWGGSGQIWVWGHNHRGQLGGVEGAKVKLPQPCEQLAALRPVQLIGGEQTLFAITGDGKVSHSMLTFLVFRTVIITLLYAILPCLPYLTLRECLLHIILPYLMSSDLTELILSYVTLSYLS